MAWRCKGEHHTLPLWGPPLNRSAAAPPPLPNPFVQSTTIAMGLDAGAVQGCQCDRHPYAAKRRGSICSYPSEPRYHDTASVNCIADDPRRAGNHEDCEAM